MVMCIYLSVFKGPNPPGNFILSVIKNVNFRESVGLLPDPIYILIRLYSQWG